MQLLLNIFLCFSKCVAALRCISLFFNERAAASERYQGTAASERKCAADIFCVCAAASRNISMFLMNLWLLLKRYNRLLLKEKCAAVS